MRDSRLKPIDSVRDHRNEVFNHRHLYEVYLAPEPGGGSHLLLVDVRCRQGGFGAMYEVPAYQIAKGACVSHTIRQAALLSFRRLGTLSGLGAERYFQAGGNILDFIDTYGQRTRKPGLWTRIKRRFGFGQKKKERGHYRIDDRPPI